MSYAGNPDMGLVGKASSPAKTPIGIFRRDLSKFSRAKVPNDLLELYDWYKGLDTRKINYILEMKNLYQVLQKAMLPALIDKLSHGETPSKKEIDALRLLKDIMSESHKLKYGDKKVIENVVSVSDIRRQMRSDHRIIDVEAIPNEPVSQNLDRSRRREGSEQEDRENSRDNDSSKES